MKFFWGMIAIAAGVIMVWKTYPLVQFFGKFPWAERIFGGGFGGTYFFFKLAGLILIFLSMMYMFGMLDNIVSPFGNFFGGMGQR